MPLVTIIRDPFVKPIHGLVAACGLLAIAGVASAGEVIVDPTGLGDQLTIQAGIDVAVDGDVIIVRPGTYEGALLIDGKSIWIVPQIEATVSIHGTVRIENLTQAQDVLLVDLEFTADTDHSGVPQRPTLSIEDCAGRVHVQDCAITGVPGSRNQSPPVGGSAARFVRASRVVVVASTLVAGREDDPALSSDCNGGEGGVAIEAIDSRVTAWGMEVRGGLGSSCDVVYGVLPGRGGDGIQLLRSEMFASGCSVNGGRGGDDNDFIPATGGPGGDAVRVGASSRAVIVDSAVAGGSGGSSYVGQPGPPGSAYVGQGTVRLLPGVSELRSTPTFVRGQSVHSVTVEGAPGLTATLYIVPHSPFLFDALLNAGSLGPIMSAPPVSRLSVSLGTIPASGTLNASIGIPLLPPTSTTTRFDFVVVTGSGPFRNLVGNPVPVVAVNCNTVLPDCNANGASDLCELIEGSATDLDRNGVVDSCEPDCNGNGIVDAFDISSGTSQDANGDGIPDECQQQPSTWHVDAAAPPGGDGSQAQPFQTIGEGVAASLTGHQVIVMDGTYSRPGDRNVEFSGREIHVRSQNGPANCTIDLAGQGRAFYFFNEQNNPGAIIEGLRIINGVAPISPGAGRGGAILAWASDPTIRNCIFEDNQSGDGGAVALRSSDSTISGCTFRRNRHTAPGSQGGGGLSAVFGRITILDCLFEDNTASSVGGGLWISAGTVDPIVVSRCIFRGNHATSYGGGISASGVFVSGPDLHYIDQCLFDGNEAGSGGAIGGAGGGTTYVSNCTMTANVAQLFGGGIGARFNMDVVVRNSILWGNLGGMGDQLAAEGSASTLSVESCNVAGGAAAVELSGGGALQSFVSTIDSDPLFIDPDGPDNDPATYFDNDFRLGAGSPSVDAGDNSLIPDDRADVDGNGNTMEPVPLDLIDGPRRRDDPAVPDTGIGSAPVVDHGPYER